MNCEKKINYLPNVFFSKENDHVKNWNKVSSKNFLKENILYSIQVQNLTFSFKDGKNVAKILNNFNLKVRLGEIYGLLGPSGCGKTTFIRSILGLISPKQGEMLIFHRNINSSNGLKLQIPGKDVGYMPQDYTLYDDLTVFEQLVHHSALHNVNRNRFEIYKLLDLMELGELINLKVANLSGGQARRLSFACAIIHKPRLLILDEPTVGVDPVLRQKLWKILKDYVADCKASVLITTHYIEEARKADTVGFMRKGSLLAEDNPDKLIKKYQSTSLEEVFFKLCIKQSIGEKVWQQASSKFNYNKFDENCDFQLYNLSEISSGNETFHNEGLHTLIKDESFKLKQVKDKEINPFKLKQKQNEIKRKQIDELFALKATNHILSIFYWFYQLFVVTKRVLKQTLRQRSALIAQFILPLITVLLFYLCVGSVPKNIKIAIFNEEISPDFSSLYLQKLNPKIVSQVNYTNLSLALDSVRKLDSWGVLHFPINFSSALIERTQIQVENLNDEISDDLLDQSTIKLYADLANKVLAITLTRYLQNSLNDFLNQTLTILGYKSNLISLPIQLEKVIFGSFYSENDSDFFALRDYGTSGILVILTYTISFGLTVLLLTQENQAQMIERNFVIGISSTITIIAHLFVRFLLCNLNVALILYTSLQLFHAPINVSIYWPFLLLMTQSLTGLTHGMFVSSLLSNLFIACILSNGILIVLFVMSGILWPIQSLPEYLKYISIYLPTTIPTESLRWMLNKGENVSSPNVYFGFIVSLTYSVIFFILTVILSKNKR